MSNVETLAAMGCGVEILNSCIERGNIQASIYNCNVGVKYAKQCLFSYQVSKEFFWIESANNFLLPYYNTLLKVEPLADKYDFLWKEKYCKAKLNADKIINKLNNITL